MLKKPVKPILKATRNLWQLYLKLSDLKHIYTHLCLVSTY